MLALVTGASSGIGFEISKELSKMGYNIIAVGQKFEKLNKLKNECSSDVKIEVINLSNVDSCKELVSRYKDTDIDILVNSAGIGAIGKFENIPLDNELDMININIVALHILLKGFLEKMVKRNYGYILNVSSSAAYAPGPLMASYYSTKSYVYKLSRSISIELKKKKNNIYVGVLCPGPVDTNFNSRLNIKFSVNPVSAEYVAKYSINKMFKKKEVIVPGLKTKFGIFFSKIIPESILGKFIYNMQYKKMN